VSHTYEKNGSVMAKEKNGLKKEKAAHTELW
jgi:hypothetical protein